MSRNEILRAFYCFVIAGGLLFFCDPAHAQRRAVTPADDAPYYQLEFAERNRESATRITLRPNEMLSVELKAPAAR